MNYAMHDRCLLLWYFTNTFLEYFVFRSIIYICLLLSLIFLKLFLSAKGVASSENQRSIFKCLWMSHFFIKQQESVTRINIL